MERLRAVLLGPRVILFDRERARRLYFNEGFYGKFYSISKPKTPNIEKELELSLFDALYLVERKKRLELVDLKGRVLSPEEIRRTGVKFYENFEEAYAVYKDLRDKGLIVKSGMKFGATFVVYKLGPGLEHAPFLVHVLSYNSKLDPLEIIRAGRLSHSVRKRFIVAFVDPEGRAKYLRFQWLM